VVLSWSYSAPLASDEFFEVRVSPNNPPTNGIANTQGTSYSFGGGFPAGSYYWTIAVIRKDGGTITTLVKASQVLRFTWQPASSGSSGGGGAARRRIVDWRCDLRRQGDEHTTSNREQRTVRADLAAHRRTMITCTLRTIVMDH